ncbi:hypothetical protein AGOR_G00119280 [Albula goreensis]|uniref:Uncharacterized protein n=1 Tax=Albula goreensis TaxID=1534307 RepID=A0A8T3DD90_9TELE|nr:hypothetical protein AGOR_G00119280 [Albula goreensis]
MMAVSYFETTRWSYEKKLKCKKKNTSIFILQVLLADLTIMDERERDSSNIYGRLRKIKSLEDLPPAARMQEGLETKYGG